MPQIIVVRHGQAEHNVAFEAVGEAAYLDAQYRDSKLTQLGAKPARIEVFCVQITCGAFRA
jgi:broad specificity phosphatase PhoE